MYDLPELRQATDAWWRGLSTHLRSRGIDAPAELGRDGDPAADWADPELLLSQTCGYPFMTRFRAELCLVATPVYEAPGCAEGRYSSAIVVRRDDPARTLHALRGRRAVVNGLDSQSGHNALRAALAPLAMDGRFLGGIVVSGAHRRSLEMVVAGDADLAAVDGVTFALWNDIEPALAARVRLLAWTPSAPGLPYVTSAGRPSAQVSRIREALLAAAADPALAEPRAALRLRGFRTFPAEAYEAILDMETAAVEAGYRELA